MSSSSNQIVDGSLVISEKTIDVKELIKSKNEKLARLMPRFLLKYLKRIIHEDDLNKILYDNRSKHGLQFVEEIVKMFGANLEIEGIENVRSENRFIIASNHPLGGLDGIALMHIVGKEHSNIRFPVNDFLLFLPTLKELFIPINKVGKQSLAAAKELDRVLDSDINLLYFPAGLASRKIKGKIVDLEWKKTFIQKAKKHERNIIPTYVSGQNSNFFYRLAKIRKFLHIKLNIEMLFLVNETFKQKDKTLKITFGKPIPYTVFDKSKTDKEWAEYIKQIVYNLK